MFSLVFGPHEMLGFDIYPTIIQSDPVYVWNEFLDSVKDIFKEDNEVICDAEGLLFMNNSGLRLHSDGTKFRRFSLNHEEINKTADIENIKKCAIKYIAKVYVLGSKFFKFHYWNTEEEKIYTDEEVNNPTNVMHELISLVKKTTVGDVRKLFSFVHQKDNLNEILREILQNPQLCSERCKSSFVCRDGLVTLNLYSDEQKFFDVNIWWPYTSTDTLGIRKTLEVEEYISFFRGKALVKHFYDSDKLKPLHNTIYDSTDGFRIVNFSNDMYAAVAVADSSNICIIFSLIFSENNYLDPSGTMSMVTYKQELAALKVAISDTARVHTTY